MLCQYFVWTSGVGFDLEKEELGIDVTSKRSNFCGMEKTGSTRNLVLQNIWILLLK